MPVYCYVCEDCGEKFEITAMMCELDAVQKQLRCPACGSLKVVRDYGEEGVYASEAIKTVGSIADRNSDKFSDDYKEYKQEQDKKLRSQTSVLDKVGAEKYDPNKA